MLHLNNAYVVEFTLGGANGIENSCCTSINQLRITKWKLLMLTFGLISITQVLSASVYIVLIYNETKGNCQTLQGLRAQNCKNSVWLIIG
jgi:hypothetical protein